MGKGTKLFIKGMVCNRCVLVVKNELNNLGYTPAQVELGVVTLPGEEAIDQAALEKRLSPLGFGLLEDSKLTIIKAVKALVNEVYSGEFDFPGRFRFAALAEVRLNCDYDRISEAFIDIERKNIEQYIIDYRINKVKEYLVYSNYTLSDIAFRLNFNSVAHLSTQFKQQTGLTPSFFKSIKKQKSEVIFSMN